jgi:hypothetical protein
LFIKDLIKSGQVIMTPVIFVSFLVSLAWVDFRYTIVRSHNHDSGDRGRMPGWLHHVIYRRSPYQYVKVKEAAPQGRDDTRWEPYYHSKQRKLMRMEVEDAFQVRSHVLVVMALILAVSTWGFLRLCLGLWAACSTM